MDVIADSLESSLQRDFDLARVDLADARRELQRKDTPPPAGTWRSAEHGWTASWTCGTPCCWPRSDFLTAHPHDPDIPTAGEPPGSPAVGRFSAAAPRP
jgi:hypothetical protein